MWVNFKTLQKIVVFLFIFFCFFSLLCVFSLRTFYAFENWEEHTKFTNWLKIKCDNLGSNRVLFILEMKRTNPKSNIKIWKWLFILIFFLLFILFALRWCLFIQREKNTKKKILNNVIIQWYFWTRFISISRKRMKRKKNENDEKLFLKIQHITSHSSLSVCVSLSVYILNDEKKKN